MRPLAKPLKYACAATVVAAILNFITFWCLAATLGGDALNGVILIEHRRSPTRKSATFYVFRLIRDDVRRLVSTAEQVIR
jgi:hypothetical protein